MVWFDSSDLQVLYLAKDAVDQAGQFNANYHSILVFPDKGRENEGEKLIN